MATSIIHACILVSVIYVTFGQSTSADPRCVYTFHVPTSDCGQTPGPGVDDQLLKSSVIALQAQVKQLASDSKQLASDNKQLASDNKQLASGDNNQHSSTGGAVYIRWGRKTCPGNGTDLLYSGTFGSPLMFCIRPIP
ncbi:hypothetical protein NP493_812g02034 [Ridgeia piscesae]|uniref:Uncharacterized protein n=1 Tax=Ridgeia piscesae TaxID=27915 RepID=A0AAD9KN15_RIDPI|nr:hypothetical protein NP493_812g02034 [Ridgeia piscesae]